MISNFDLHSPNKKYRLNYFNQVEPRMGMTLCSISLTDIKLETTTLFNPIAAIGYNGISTSWSDNSYFFALPIAKPLNCIFIYNIYNKEFTTIAIKNPWIVKCNCSNYSIRIELKDNQIPNTEEHNKYPSKIYKKPPRIVLSFSDLQWNPFESILYMEELNINNKVFDIKPIDMGWRLFRGELPVSTEITVWELEKFAEYGDKQSIEWMEAINKLTINVNTWDLASKYLGHHERKEQE